MIVDKAVRFFNFIFGLVLCVFVRASIALSPRRVYMVPYVLARWKTNKEFVLLEGFLLFYRLSFLLSHHYEASCLGFVYTFGRSPKAKWFKSSGFLRYMEVLAKIGAGVDEGGGVASRSSECCNGFNFGYNPILLKRSKGTGEKSKRLL